MSNQVAKVGIEVKFLNRDFDNIYIQPHSHYLKEVQKDTRREVYKEIYLEIYRGDFRKENIQGTYKGHTKNIQRTYEATYKRRKYGKRTYFYLSMAIPFQSSSYY